MFFLRTSLFLSLVAQGIALSEPLITARAELVPRQSDPSFVGYISENSSFANPRTCDYPETVSTSGSYFQCCPTTGSCAFYTSCSDNTLFGADATVPCDVSTALTCNTGIVLPTVGASNGVSYLACWQKTIDSDPFTFIQNIQGASVAASTTAGVSTGSASSASGSSSVSGSETTQTSTKHSSSTAASSATGASTSSSASATHNMAVGQDAGLTGGVVGVLGLLAQLLL